MNSVMPSHLLETAEENQKRAESKKETEKNAVNNYGWNIFSEVGSEEPWFPVGCALSRIREAVEESADHSGERGAGGQF